MKKATLGLGLLSVVIMAFAGQENKVLDQSGNQQQQPGNGYTKPKAQSDGYKVYMTLDSVFISGHDNRVQYAWPVSDTSYLAVIKTLRTTGKFQPAR